MKNISLYSCAYCLIVFTLWACQSKKTDESAKTESAKPETPAYPTLGNKELGQLYALADHVDIIFYDLPISVNQDDVASVKNTVLYVTPASPVITGPCKALGRLSWMSQGKIIREADVFADPGCQYLLFMENNAPVYANAMAPAGVDFFRNIISQVDKVKK